AAPTLPSTAQLSLDAIGEQAEVVAEKLRAMTEDLESKASILALETEVFEYHQRVAGLWAQTDRLLGQTPRRGPIEAIASSWQALRRQITGLRGAVDERLRRRDADLRTLDRLRGSWSWTLDHTRQIGAPQAIIGHVESTLAAIDATRARVEQRHAPLPVPP